MKKKIGYLLLEIIPVMIGVFLGFLISNWAEGRKKTSQTEMPRKNIVGEIKDNMAKIYDVIGYHEMLRDSSRYYLNRTKPVEQPRFFPWCKYCLTHKERV